MHFVQKMMFSSLLGNIIQNSACAGIGGYKTMWDMAPEVGKGVGLGLEPYLWSEMVVQGGGVEGMGVRWGEGGRCQGV